MKSLSKILSYIRLIYKSNVMLGFYFYCRKKIIGLRSFDNSYPDELNWNGLFSISMDELNNFISTERNKYEQIIYQADLFLKNKIIIYNYEVDLYQFTVEKYGKIKSDKTYINDLRFYWEIYRAPFIHMVGLAYMITGNENYAKALLNYLDNWQTYTPFTSDSMEYNGMESSIRLINLSWIHFYLNKSNEYTKYYKSLLCKILAIHAQYSYRNYDITKYGLESNHGLSCSVGLIYASFLFTSYGPSIKWKRMGLNGLKRALKTQFSNEGSNFESSVQYHRFTFEMLIFLLAVFYKNENNIEEKFVNRIRQIGNTLISLTHSNNNISRIGDSDGGKFLPCLNTIDDFNSLCYLQWFLLGNEKQYFETLMFHGIKEFRGFLHSDTNIYNCNNYFFIKSDSISLIGTANNIGTNGKGNHQHNDFLSFELYGNNPFIVDPWTYCYTGNKQLRNIDRKTVRHNTVCIDSREIVEFDSSKLFEFLGNINAEIMSITNDDTCITVSVAHNGYVNLQTGKQNCKRIIKYFRTQNIFEINDILEGRGKHTANINFYIPQKFWKMKIIDNSILFSNDEETFKIETDWKIKIIDDAYISSYFLNEEKAYKIELEAQYENNLSFKTSIKYRRN